MKGGREEDKVMGPLFPRLHVNDTDKGGPRAPPRNKMALYEQLSIPSQRFNSTSSAMPFPPRNSNSLVPSLSSSQGCGQLRKIISPFCMTPQVPVRSTETSRTSDGMNPVTKRIELGRNPTKQVSSGNLFGARSAAECSFQRQENPSVRNSSEKVLDDADDIVVPTFDQSEMVASMQKDTDMTNAGMLTTVISPKMQENLTAVNSLCQYPNSNEKSLEETEIAEIRLQNSDRTRIEDLRETSAIDMTKETKENSQSNNIAKQPNSSKDFVKTDTNNFHLTDKSVTVLCRENGDVSDIAISDSRKSLKAKTDLYSKMSPRKSSKNLSKDFHNKDNAKRNGSLVFGVAERQHDAYEPSMGETVSSLEISPDDIVGVIGTKHFWKARRAIINQQRVFGMQVFELHRLIEVQKSIAASPQLLLEGQTYLNKPSVKTPNNTKIPQCNNTNSQPVELRGQDDLHKAKHNLEQPIEDDVDGVPALPAYEDGSKMSTQVRVSKVGQNSVIPPSLPMAPDDKQSPWCFPPLANQWLVPVMSPSEGLVYKPYSGPCPSPGGFMAPLYGGCTPLGLSPLPGDFVNPAYGVPASHQPPNMVLSGPPAIPPHYYPIPYNLRPLNPMISSSAVEQVSNLAGSQANGQTVQYSRGSCNMLHPPRDKVFSGNLGKFQVSKNSELQGSTASSPTEAARPEGRLQIPPLPTSPVANSLNCPSQSSGRDSQTRVIKVVPHNARSATESAVRIFQSIQQERQQHDS
ncbi:protein HEADING DATE 3B-like [Curcuma longa]|uniref:protein HEADING DATE 3B-like n=1 Tax=Curcuma longa TaxID=136217 RepID=UPI003D9E2AA4